MKSVLESIFIQLFEKKAYGRLVSNVNFCFSFVTPLSALAGTAGAASTAGVPADGGIIPFPDVSVTLPGEDMNLGSRG